MQRIKWELEDLSLKYLDPVGYSEIVSKLGIKQQEYDAFMQKIQGQINQRLGELGIQHTVYGRMKHPYSIYRKMFNQNKSLDEIFDLFAFRVIVESVGDCYNVLGVIHDIYKPILGRFKDYIGTPKPNGYQSLHTTVMGSDGIPFEVQIRTTEMHEIAEYGVAAHWKYKQNGQGSGTEGKYEWVRRLLENQEGADAEDYIHSLKIDMGADNITVHTLSLKKGSGILSGGISIPSAEAVGEMLSYADPVLRAHGYGPYYLYRQKYMVKKETKQTFLGGAAILAAAVVIVKIIGAVYLIPLNNILGSEGKTYFRGAYNIYNVLMAFSVGGFPLAISKLTSEAQALGRENEKRRLFRTAMIPQMTSASELNAPS